MERAGPSDDTELLRRLRAGDGQALRELMSAYDRLVRYAIFKLCRSECRRDGTFLDARASETWSGFVDSIRRRDTPYPRGLKTYLLQIARNKCADALRNRGVTAVALDDLGPVEAPTEAGIDLAIRAEEIMILKSCMESITSDEQRVCEQLEYILDGRWTRAGEALGMAESTLRTRWPGILAKLRSCVEGKSGKRFAPPAVRPDS